MPPIQGRSDVLLLGASVASLVLGLRLAQKGCKIRILQTAQVSPSSRDLGVLWPDLGEHWGVLLPVLGEIQCSGLIQLVQRSQQLLLEDPAWHRVAGQKGAVLQLADDPAEMAEMTMELPWVSRHWPRRLMGSGSASNYLGVEEIAGAAFVADCSSFEPAELRFHWLQRLQSFGVEVEQVELVHGVGEACARSGSGHCAWIEADGKRWESELLFVGAGHKSLAYLGSERNWLFPLRGAALPLGHHDVRGQLLPWNRALAGVEAYRGHLMLRHHGEWGWLLAGLSPASGWEALTDSEEVEPALLDKLQALASRLLSDLPVGAREKAWSLISTCSADGLPLVGPMPGSARTWLMAGFSTRSWSLGPALGESLARVVLGEGCALLEQLPCLRPSRWL